MTKVLVTADRQKEIVPIFDIAGAIAITLQSLCATRGLRLFPVGHDA